MGTGGNAAELERLCDSSVFPNYAHIAEYYWRIPPVAQQRAAEGMRQLLATSLLRSENQEQATTYISRQKNVLPDRMSADWLKYLGLAYLDLARWLKKDDTGTLDGTGTLKERRDALDSASNYLGKALNKDNSDFEARILLSSCFFEIGLIEEQNNSTTKASDEWYYQAVSEARTAIKMNSCSALAYLARASAYGKLDNFNQSLSDLDDALRLDDRLATAYYQRAMQYAVKGDDMARNNGDATGEYKHAIADYKQAYFCGYSYKAGILLGTGEALLKLERYSDARTKLSDAMALLDGKKRAKAGVMYAIACQRMEEKEAAKKTLKDIVVWLQELAFPPGVPPGIPRPDETQLLFGCARLLTSLNDEPGARAVYKKIIEAYPDFNSEVARLSYINLQLL